MAVRKRSGWLLAALPALVAWAPAPVLADPVLVIRGDPGQVVQDCAAGSAQVVGNGNRVVIAGACRTLDVFGSGNSVVVDLEPGAVVRVAGNRNRVAYRTAAGTPTVAISGRDDIVRAAAAAELAVLPPPPGPLVIPAGALSGRFACAGLDVVIHASYGRYDLRGGCRSVTVDGAATTIVAELAPGAPVAIGAAGVTMNYVLVADGPPPQVRVTVPGEQATHIERHNGSFLKLPTAQVTP